MEAIRRQASKLREQVAKQQQAVLRQLSKEAAIFDDEELQGHQKLQDLYYSTRAAKHFQRDILRGVEGFISVSKKQMEIARKLAEDCCKYGAESHNADLPLARAALDFGTSHGSIEDKRETMLGIFVDQVSGPLRASIRGAPLEDARHLAHSCDRLRQEVEAQAVDVLRRQSKYRDPSEESVLKLKSSEAKLNELRSSMIALQREATSAMLSVEEQQQEITLQKLLTMVDAERSYHRKVVDILEELHTEMIQEMHLQESLSDSATMERHLQVPPGDTQSEHDGHENANKNSATMERHVHVPPGDAQSENDGHESDNQNDFFIGKVIHSFDAQTDGELSIAVDEYVVVRQVANGWSEGECNGKAGWFPLAYVERQDKAPANKLTEETDSL